jgi:crotonobetainyl-CoA:carnitine CoA-transferase CaiB-like acyl-CoA transferase
VPHAPINDYESALADPQVGHMGWVQPMELPNGARTRTFATPLRINGAAAPITSAPPALGQHTAEIRARYAVPHCEENSRE